MSVLSEVSDGSFIYLRELGYILRLIFQGVEGNYSRGKRFGDKFWKCETLDVLSVGFEFCDLRSSRRARADRVSVSMRC